MDVLGLDGERVAAGGGDPCGLGEQAEDAGIAFAGFGEQVGGGRVKDFALESGAGDVPVEVGGDVLAGEFDEPCGGADAGEEGALDGEAQAAEEVVVAEKDHGHGTAASASGSQKQADFFECGGGVVLGVVEDEHEGDGFEFGEVFFQKQEVAGALEAGAFTEFGEQDFQDSCGREVGVGNEQRQEAFGFEAGDPAFEECAFAGARGAGQEHEAAQGGCGVEQFEGFAVTACGEELRGFFVRRKGCAVQAPCAQEVFEGVWALLLWWWRGKVSAHGWSSFGGCGGCC